MSIPTATRRYLLSCHCQKNILELTLPLPQPPLDQGTPFNDNRICDCSHCVKRRIVRFFVPRRAVKVIKRGGEELKMYRFGSDTSDHPFCGTCGTYISGASADDENEQVVINLRTIRDKDFELWSLPLTRYSGMCRDPPYSPQTLLQGAEAYLTERAKHYDYRTQVYTGSCPCQAVTFEVVCKPLEEVLVMDCSCSLCTGNGVLWVYPGRHDVFFHPSPSPSKPYEPDPNLVTRYAFNQRRNEHILCKTCGCQIFEAREAKEGEKFDGWEEENLDDGNSFGINVALFNGMEEYLADGIGEKFRGLRKNERERWKEPLYEVKLTEG